MVIRLRILLPRVLLRSLVVLIWWRCLVRVRVLVGLLIRVSRLLRLLLGLEWLIRLVRLVIVRVWLLKRQKDLIRLLRLRLLS